MKIDKNRNLLKAVGKIQIDKNRNLLKAVGTDGKIKIENLLKAVSTDGTEGNIKNENLLLVDFQFLSIFILPSVPTAFSKFRFL